MTAVDLSEQCVLQNDSVDSFVETVYTLFLPPHPIRPMPFLPMLTMGTSFLKRRDESRLYKGWMVWGTMEFVINVLARRDADLSRLEKQT